MNHLLKVLPYTKVRAVSLIKTLACFGNILKKLNWWSAP